MFGSIERYSSAVRRKRFALVQRRAVLSIVLALALYLLLTNLLVATYRIDSVSMSPRLQPSDRVMASPTPYFPGFRGPARGDLVVVRSPFFERAPFWKVLGEPVLRFFTLQNASLYRDPDGSGMRGYLVKRVVGLPGDTIRLKDFRLQVRPSGRTEFMEEAAAAAVPYRLDFRFSPDGWNPRLPFSGNGNDIVLGPEEYFVLGDNRPVSSDSRSWGPVSRSRIMAKVFFRYWPPRSFGRL